MRVRMSVHALSLESHRGPLLRNSRDAA
jgi:hypothetical protein